MIAPPIKAGMNSKRTLMITLFISSLTITFASLRDQNRPANIIIRTLYSTVNKAPRIINNTPPNYNHPLITY